MVGSKFEANILIEYLQELAKLWLNLLMTSSILRTLMLTQNINRISQKELYYVYRNPSRLSIDAKHEKGR